MTQHTLFFRLPISPTLNKVNKHSSMDITDCKNHKPWIFARCKVWRTFGKKKAPRVGIFPMAILRRPRDLLLPLPTKRLAWMSQNAQGRVGSGSRRRPSVLGHYQTALFPHISPQDSPYSIWNLCLNNHHPWQLYQYSASLLGLRACVKALLWNLSVASHL